MSPKAERACHKRDFSILLLLEEEEEEEGREGGASQ